MNRAVKAIADLMQSEPERWHWGRSRDVYTMNLSDIHPIIAKGKIFDTWSHPCGVMVMLESDVTESGSVKIGDLKLTSEEDALIRKAATDIMKKSTAATAQHKETERLLGLIRTREQRVDYQTRRARLTGTKGDVWWKDDITFDSLPPL